MPIRGSNDCLELGDLHSCVEVQWGPLKIQGQTQKLSTNYNTVHSGGWTLPFYKESPGKDKRWKEQVTAQDSRRRCFPMRTVGYKNHLPRQVVDSHTLDSFKAPLDRVLEHLISTTLSPWKSGPDDSWGVFQPGILWFYYMRFNISLSLVSRGKNVDE